MTKEELIELKESLLNNEIVLDEQKFYLNDYTYKYKEREWHITDDSIDIYPKVLGNKIFVESIEDIIEYTVRNLINNNINFDTIRLKLQPIFYTKDNYFLSQNRQYLQYPFNNIKITNIAESLNVDVNLTLYDHSKIDSSYETNFFLYDNKLEINNNLITNNFKIIQPNPMSYININNYIDFYKIIDQLEKLGYRVSYTKDKIIVTVDFTKNRIRKLHI